jgi:hypothetical protein
MTRSKPLLGYKTAGKEFYFEWTTGATHVEETALLVSGASKDDFLTECTYLVDAEECNS